MSISKISAFLCILFVLQQQANAQNLDVNFYQKTCPSLASIVKETTASFVSRAPTLAPALLRMHFHDCFVRGCDASVLLNATSTNNPAEKDAPPNQSLRGYHVIDAVKDAVESKCRSTVSCADILALVARDAVVEINGPSWPVPLGRRDGRVSSAAETTDLPPPFANITRLISMFADKGLSVQDLVILSGSHTIGIAHCRAIDNRIYNSSAPGGADPTMDRNYVAALRRRCPQGDQTTLIQMDPGSSQNFDTAYFSGIGKRRGLFESDAALLNNPETSRYVQQHSTASGQSSFFNDFANSMVKMGHIGVLTGSAGEIRRICSVIN